MICDPLTRLAVAYARGKLQPQQVNHVLDTDRLHHTKSAEAIDEQPARDDRLTLGERKVAELHGYPPINPHRRGAGYRGHAANNNETLSTRLPIDAVPGATEGHD